MPALAGCVLGVVAGNLLAGAAARPDRAGVRGRRPGRPAVGGPGGAAGHARRWPRRRAGAALRAGRLSAVQAIATGRAPRPARGYAAHRLLGRVRPAAAGGDSRPGRAVRAAWPDAGDARGDLVRGGRGDVRRRPGHLAGPGCGRPARSARTGAGADRRPAGRRRSCSLCRRPAPPPGRAGAAVQAALRAQPGTLRYVTESEDQLGVLGLAGTASVTAFGGDASWTGYALISGHWYGARRGRREHRLPHRDRQAGGGHVHARRGGRHVTVRIAGEVFDPGGGAEVIGEPVHPGRARSGPEPAISTTWRCRPGVSARATRTRSAPGLGQDYQVNASGGNSSQFPIISGLIVMLTLLLAAVAGLGVLNTVVLQTRERVHDLGVFKAVGMTPRQTIAMVVCTVAGDRPGRRPDRDPGRDRPAPLHPAGHGPRRADRRCPLGAQRLQPARSSSCWRWPAWSSRWSARSPRPAGRPGPAPRSRCAPSKRQPPQRSGCRSARPGGPPAGRPRSAARTGRTARTARPPAAPARRRSPPAAPAPPRAARPRAAARRPASRPPGRARRRSRPRWRPPRARRTPAPARPPAAARRARSASSSSRGSAILPTLTAGLTSAAVEVA